MKQLMPAPTAAIARYQSRHPQLNTTDVLRVAVKRLLTLTEDTKDSVVACYRNKSITRTDASELLALLHVHCDDIEVMLSVADRENERG